MSATPAPGSAPTPAPAAGDGPAAGRAGASAPHRPRPPKFPDGPAARPHPRPERRIATFHPRRGRMTAAQFDAINRLWPRWGVEIDGTPLDPAALFAATAQAGQAGAAQAGAGEGMPVVLEIGFGMGEATALMAAADPGTGILAVDVHTPGQGNLLRLAERAGLANIRVGNGDAVVLLRDMLPPASLAGLRVYFPDPWPKARHHKRRIIQPDFVALAVSRLRPGALLHCATDWEPYAEQMDRVLSAEPALANTCGTGYAPRPDFRPVTKFERQGLAKGHRVHDLLFRRV